MAEHPGLDTSPFYIERGPVGCLLIHGFTGAPAEMRLMGEYLAGQGVTVLGPRLPGHGTRLEDMLSTRWGDWAAEAERGLLQLQSRSRFVFVAGLSMGGLLTLYLAARHSVTGIIPMATAISVSSRLMALAPLAKYVVREIPKSPPTEEDYTDPEAFYRHWSYDAYPLVSVHELRKLQRVVRRQLSRINAPALIIQGAKDNMVPPESASMLWKELGSSEKELLMMHNSAHCLTVDAEREEVWRAVYAFIQRHAGDNLDPQNGCGCG